MLRYADLMNPLAIGFILPPLISLNVQFPNQYLVEGKNQHYH